MQRISEVQSATQSSQQAQLEAFLKSGKLNQFVRTFIRPMGIRDLSLDVQVDYDLSIEEMIKRGSYDYAVRPDLDHGITAKRWHENGRRRVYPVSFGRQVTNEEVMEVFEKHDLRAADLAEYLAFGATCPDFQRRFHITTLDFYTESESDYVHYLDLRSFNGGRDLCYYWYDMNGDIWYPYFYFLATDK